MPNIKAAEKWVLQSEKRRVRNLSTKTRLRTLTKKAALSGERAEASAAESQLDKAAAKGIIHPNKAARKKSRLAQALRARGGAAEPSPAQRPRAASKR